MMPFLIAGLARAAAIIVLTVGVAMSGSGSGVTDRLERYAARAGTGRRWRRGGGRRNRS